jgi:hypothetical protein
MMGNPCGGSLFSYPQVTVTTQAVATQAPPANLEEFMYRCKTNQGRWRFCNGIRNNLPEGTMFMATGKLYSDPVELF